MKQKVIRKVKIIRSISSCSIESNVNDWVKDNDVNIVSCDINEIDGDFFIKIIYEVTQ